MAVDAPIRASSAVHPPVSPRRAVKVALRNYLAYSHAWHVFISGFFEPLFYLVGVGFGVGQFVDKIPFGDAQLDYATFLAPGLLAASTLNGAVFDGFFNPFFKLNWMKTYDGIITTPVSIPDIAVGEIAWATFRGTIYGGGFLIVMLALGLIDSAWALLALPAVMVSTAALSSGAMVLVGLTSQISALEKVMTLIVVPMFLFSGTFYPVSLYPEAMQPIVRATPLYHSASLLRCLTTGEVGLSTVGNAAYLIGFFIVFGTLAVRLMRRRLIS